MLSNLQVTLSSPVHKVLHSKEKTRRKKYKPILLMNIDTNILNKVKFSEGMKNNISWPSSVYPKKARIIQQEKKLKMICCVNGLKEKN